MAAKSVKTIAALCCAGNDGPGLRLRAGFFYHGNGENGRQIRPGDRLQDGMLQKLRDKITGSELKGIITLHKCPVDRIGVTDPVDFVLIFYMLHEVPDQEKYLKEIAALLKPNGKILLVEPPFHVSKSEFEATLNKAKAAHLAVVESPKVFMGRTAVLEKAI